MDKREALLLFLFLLFSITFLLNAFGAFAVFEEADNVSILEALAQIDKSFAEGVFEEKTDISVTIGSPCPPSQGTCPIPQQPSVQPALKTIDFEWNNLMDASLGKKSYSLDFVVEKEKCDDIFAARRPEPRYKFSGQSKPEANATAIKWYSNYFTSFIDHRQSSSELKRLAGQLESLAEKEGFSEYYPKANFVASFVAKGFDYIKGCERGEGNTQFPLEVVCRQKGNCEDRSLLVVSLLREMDYDTGFVYINRKEDSPPTVEAHLMAAIKKTGSGLPEGFKERASKLKFKNEEGELIDFSAVFELKAVEGYYLIESIDKSFIGFVDKMFLDSRNYEKPVLLPYQVAG